MKTLWNIIVLMRPKQWTKNLVLFAGIAFSERFSDPVLVEKSVLGFVIFCFLSGVVYIINDIIDRERDGEHPVKSRRPLASGAVAVAPALLVAIILLCCVLLASWFLGMEFFIVSVVFFALNIAYTLVLREIVILDVISISFSFLTRAVAGVAVLHGDAPDIELSPWLLICTLFLSLFLGLCKRRNEIYVLESVTGHRNSLNEYSGRLLDQLVGLSATAALISYSIYTVWPGTVEKFGTINLVYTIPFVVFGIMRYLYLVYSKHEGGDPSEVLITEKSILIDVFLWFIAVVFIIVRA